MAVQKVIARHAAAMRKAAHPARVGFLDRMEAWSRQMAAKWRGGVTRSARSACAASDPRLPSAASSRRRRSPRCRRRSTNTILWCSTACGDTCNTDRSAAGGQQRQPSVLPTVDAGRASSPAVTARRRQTVPSRTPSCCGAAADPEPAALPGDGRRQDQLSLTAPEPRAHSTHQPHPHAGAGRRGSRRGSSVRAGSLPPLPCIDGVGVKRLSATG